MPSEVRAGKLAITVDVPQLDRGIRRTVAVYAAIRETVDGIRPGEVVASRRKKIAGELRQPIHGAFVLNIFRRRGIELINVHNAHAIRSTTRLLERSIARAIDRAARTLRPQTRAVDEAFLTAAKKLAGYNRRYFANARFGRKPTQRVVEVKASSRNRSHSRTVDLMPVYRRRVERGLMTARYGLPPPVGVQTGRLVDGSTAGVRDGIRGVSGRPIRRA